MSVRPLYTSPTGVKYLWRDDGDQKTIISVQDTDPIIEHNKAAQNHNDGYTKSREMRRVASIPMIFVSKWLHDHGVNVLSNDAETQRWLARRLNDPEYRFLRTAPGQLGVKGETIR